MDPFSLCYSDDNKRTVTHSIMVAITVTKKKLYVYADLYQMDISVSV